MKMTSVEQKYIQMKNESRILLANRIKEMRKNGIHLKFLWRNKVWPTKKIFTENNRYKNFNFNKIGCGHKKKLETDEHLLPWLEDFAKVFAARSLCGDPYIATVKDSLYAIKWLNEGVLGTPANGIQDLIPLHFERAMDLIISKYPNRTQAYNLIHNLKNVADKIDDLNLSNSKLRFQPKFERPLQEIKDRTIDPFIRDVLYHCINNPIDENERILMETLRIHFAWGGRIGETLRLVSSSYFKDGSNASIKLPRSENSEKMNYGIRYFPEKKYDNGVSTKALDMKAGQIVSEAIERLEKLCSPARERAKLLTEMPGRFPLPKYGTDQYHAPNELVTLEDIGRWMQWTFKPSTKLLSKSTYPPEMQQLNTSDQRRLLAKWKIYPVISPSGSNNLDDPTWSAGRGLHAFKYLVADLEKYFLQQFQPNILVNDSNKTIAKLHDLLIVIFDAQRQSFSGLQSPIPLLPRRLTYQDIFQQLSDKKYSIFSRRSLTMPDGSPIFVESHSGRHDRNKYLDEAGLTQIQQALSMGRAPSQNKNYQQASDIYIIQKSNISRLKKEAQNERIQIVKDAVRKELITGTITNAYHKIREINIIKAEEFLEDQVGQILVTRYGACTNEWVGQACPKHNKCFKNCKHLHITGRESEYAELQSELKIQLMHRAKVQELANQGEYKADTALEAIDLGIDGINKAIEAWHSVVKKRQKLITTANELHVIDAGIPVFENGVSNYQERNISQHMESNENE